MKYTFEDLLAGGTVKFQLSEGQPSKQVSF